MELFINIYDVFKYFSNILGTFFRVQGGGRLCLLCLQNKRDTSYKQIITENTSLS